ncbi:MAG: hypothetical protein HON55_00430 [Legionellales bacterium]|nr:hypothetical protein [Legionellales bacterium]
MKINFLLVVVLGLIFTAIITVFLYFNLNVNYTPTDIKIGKINPNKEAHVTGMVAQGSLRFVEHDMSSQFIVTDSNNHLNVIYKGQFPSSFREGKKVVLLGSLSSADVFSAKELLVVDNELAGTESK